MPIINIEANRAWAKRPTIMVSTDPDHDFDVRASIGASGCELQALYGSAGVAKTDETPLATELLFAMGLAAEESIENDLKKNRFVPVAQGAQVIYQVSVFDEVTQTWIRITGTADGLYTVPEDNEFHIPAGMNATIEMKTTQPDLFNELARPNEDGRPQGNLLSYSRQAALHSVGCEVEYAGIMVFNRGDTKEHRLITLRNDAIEEHAADSMQNIKRIVRSFIAFVETGEIPPDFDPDRSVRKGYCNGCNFRSMCHPDGIKMRNNAGSDEETIESAPSTLTEEQFADKIRRLAGMKSVVSALTKVVNSETNDLKGFVTSEKQTELSVPVALVNEDGKILSGETIEYYDGVKTDVVEFVEATLDKYTKKPSGYAHIAVTSSPGKPSLPGENLPTVLANFPELVTVGKDSSRTTVSRKAKPLTQKAMDNLNAK